MKIGPKLAVCFVAMVVLPLMVTSWIYARSSVELGRDMASKGKQVMTDRITEDLQRATDLSVSSIREIQAELLAETVRNASEIARQLMTTPDADAILGAQTTSFAAEAIEDRAQGINIERSNIRFESDADPAEALEILARLQGLGDVARTSYLRNRSTVRANSIALEAGITGWYPGGSQIESNDHRENQWYLSAMEQAVARWFASENPGFRELYAVAPIIVENGDLMGALRSIVPVKKLLDVAVPFASIPANASAYLIVVPSNHPNLFPHQIAKLTAENKRWAVLNEIEPLEFEGDDRWLKVLSDIRSGVDGLEFVSPNGRPEVWSFKPIMQVHDGVLHLAITQPQIIVEIAEAETDAVVGNAVSKQIRNATFVAIVAGLIAVGLALGAARTLTNPIRDLHQAARKLATGDFSVRVTNNSRDELGELASDFNAMVPELEDRMKVKRDLDTAREIQQYLVEQAAPTLDGFDIAGETIYCDETGGDYQDFIDVGDGQGLVAVTGDVTGHGVGAALLMAAARSSLRAHLRHQMDVGKLMKAVNKDLSADSSGGRFLTMFLALIQSHSQKFTWISAGHEVALLFDPSTDTFIELDGDGIPLGVDTTWHYVASSAEIPKGGVLVSYTDGIREAKNAAGERYGMERLKQSVRAAHARGSFAICEKMLDDWRRHCGDISPNDDVSLMVIKSIA